MFNQLVFQGYATRDLDWVAQKFVERTGKVPEVFIIKDGWKAYGSKAHLNKVLVSRFGAYACIFVPLYLSRKQIMELDASRIDIKVKPERITSDEEGNYKFSYTRHCNYCGRLYGTSPVEIVIHCGSPNCLEKHRLYLKHIKEVKKSQKKTESQSNKDKAPEFNLDDPLSSSLRGWIYLIESENGLFKIGRSNNIANRFGGLVSSSPVPLFLRHTIYSDNYVNAEKYLHQEFALQVHHGEWHRLSEQDVEWLMELGDNSLDGA